MTRLIYDMTLSTEWSQDKLFWYHTCTYGFMYMLYLHFFVSFQSVVAKILEIYLFLVLVKLNSRVIPLCKVRMQSVCVYVVIHVGEKEGKNWQFVQQEIPEL